MAELELLMAHLIREFDFNTESLTMHKKLPPESADFELGGRIEKPEFTCDIIDLDGTRMKGVYPGIADVDNRKNSRLGSHLCDS